METNLETLPIGDEAPHLVNAVIEVPVGSRNKYEYEPELGVIMRDRVLPGAVRYPTDYGFVPSTLTDRGDALDITNFSCTAFSEARVAPVQHQERPWSPPIGPGHSQERS